MVEVVVVIAKNTRERCAAERHRSECPLSRVVTSRWKLCLALYVSIFLGSIPTTQDCRGRFEKSGVAMGLWFVGFCSIETPEHRSSGFGLQE